MTGKRREGFFSSGIGALCVGFLISGPLWGQDPLPSWNDGNAKQRIVEFVEQVTDEASADFVPSEERIATFDNDGTLWTEQPVYNQVLFAVDRIRAMADDHPEWREETPFSWILEGDLSKLKEASHEELFKIIGVTHAGMTTDEFAGIVTQWMEDAKHPTLKRPYDRVVYQPMLELMDYLRANDFKVFIVSGGGVEFMRPWVEGTYGVVPEQVIGSSIVTRFEMRDGVPVLIREPKLFFVDDKEGKPIAIQKFIGRRPIAAFGNSDGDLQMLQWTAANSRRNLSVIVHHTDAQRETAYDRESSIGRLDKALDEAKRNNWLLIDMKKDWKTVFPAEK